MSRGDRHPPAGPEGLTEREPAGNVERGEGLVEDETIGVGCECAAEYEPLLLAPREPERVSGRAVREPEPIEARSRCEPPGRDLGFDRRPGQMVFGRLPDPEAPGDALEANCSEGRRETACKRKGERGLSRPDPTEDDVEARTENGVGLEPERTPLQHDPVEDDGGHAAFSHSSKSASAVGPEAATVPALSATAWSARAASAASCVDQRT